MQYYHLKSLVAAQKQELTLKRSDDSFFRQGRRPDPYVEPTLTKISFPTEKPAILLISAVGCSGKSCMARALSFDCRLPILDLAKHKPIGDNSLTGILTSAYPIERIGGVLGGLQDGTFGVIIDGLDEGRSKTTEAAFEAFLDDLVSRTSESKATSIIILGRSQVLLDAWVYLDDNKASVGLIQIDPFALDQARVYIDSHAMPGAAQRSTYEGARDAILEKLGAAFLPKANENSFLSFIGYPPVLDAIATLLRNDTNYHRIQQTLTDGSAGNLEVEMLIKIADYLLERDRVEKALPNFIEELANQVGGVGGEELRQLYTREEQCARILSRAIGVPFPKQLNTDRAINDEYERHVATWNADHPFLDGDKLRNPVFEAVALAMCIQSKVPEYEDLAFGYALSRRPSYHFLYVMSCLVKSGVDARCFNPLIQSASEFSGVAKTVSAEVDGISWEDYTAAAGCNVELEITIGFSEEEEQAEIFAFSSNVSQDQLLTFGPRLPSVHINVPCSVKLVGVPGFDSVGSCIISARNVRIETDDLVVRALPASKQGDGTGLFISAQMVEGGARSVSSKSVPFEISCEEHTLEYPLARYVKLQKRQFADSQLQQKYFRARRILLEFRSHSKGGLAKFRDKIEHERVLRNELGRRILDKLISEGVLTMDAKFFYVDSVVFARELGITWLQLRQHESSEKLESFLSAV